MSIVDVDTLAAAVPDGAKLAIAKEDTGAAIRATLALIRRGVRDLHLVCVPVSGLQADLRIRAQQHALVTHFLHLGESVHAIFLSCPQGLCSGGYRESPRSLPHGPRTIAA